MLLSRRDVFKSLLASTALAGIPGLFNVTPSHATTGGVHAVLNELIKSYAAKANEGLEESICLCAVRKGWVP